MVVNQIISPVASSSKSPATVVTNVVTDLSRRKLELPGFIESLSNGQGCTPAWSCTNLLAIPTPILSPSPSLLGLPFTHPIPPLLSITLTHFTGAPSLHLDPKGKSKSKSRLSFNLILPPCPTGSRITRLSFAPCGGHLLVGTSIDSLNGDEVDIITVFEQKSGCINEWDLTWHERVKHFGKDIGIESKRVIDLRWLGEPRKWYPKRSADDIEEVDSHPSRPLFCAPHRSPPVVGSAFLLVLSSDELLFVHLPRALPLLPMIVVLPLSSPLSLTALPTPPSQPSASLTTSTVLSSSISPQHVIDDLVANLAEVIPKVGGGPSSLSGSKGSPLSGEKTGVGALKEELRAAERKDRNGVGKRVVKAAMGMVRGNQSADLGLTTFLIATCSQPSSSPLPSSSNNSIPSPTSQLESLSAGIPLSVSLDIAAALPLPISISQYSNLNVGSGMGSPDFDMDFNGLDEAFGDPPAVIPVIAEEVNQKEEKDESGPFEAGINGERKVELCELRIELTAQGGPRLSIRPLSPIHLADPTSLGNSVRGSLTHLDWLEDIEMPRTEDASNIGSEAVCDLHLLAVLASPNVEGSYNSALTTWALSNEPYTFSEAFSGLECKKSELTFGEREWVGRRLATTVTPNNELITFVVPRLGPVFSSFVVGKHTFEDMEGEGEVSTKIWALDSSTLQPISGFSPTCLPGQNLYGRAQISPNRGLLCAIPYPFDISRQPGLVAVPLARDDRLIRTLGDHLAIAIARQVDASDLVGRVLGLKDEVATIQIVRSIRDTLQGMLPKGRSFEGSTLQVELMGIVAILYNSQPGLQLRGSIAYNVIELAACVRVFIKCEKRERHTLESNYRCESDAVWPLIGHVKWYCGFCKDLVKEILESGPVASSPRLLLILQPYTRALLIRIAEYALALQAFLASFPVHANATVDLTRTVLDDAVNYNGLVIREWTKTLEEFGSSQTVELSSENPQTKDLLVDFIIPPSFLPACTQVFQHLSNPKLIISLPPTPPTSPSATNDSLDLIRKGKLPEKGLFRMCTRCHERNQKIEIGENDTGRWQAYELGWDVRCSCGGLWVAIDKIIQSRSHYINSSSQLQFKKLDKWIEDFKQDLNLILRREENFLERFILFGEWMVAVHRATSTFLTRKQLSSILNPTSIPLTPLIYTGKNLIKEEEMLKMIEGESKFSSVGTNSRMEGIYIKIEDEIKVLNRCKIVRGDFITSNDHWSKNVIEFNELERN